MPYIPHPLRPSRASGASIGPSGTGHHGRNIVIFMGEMSREVTPTGGGAPPPSIFRAPADVRREAFRYPPRMDAQTSVPMPGGAPVARATKRHRARQRGATLGRWYARLARAYDPAGRLTPAELARLVTRLGAVEQAEWAAREGARPSRYERRWLRAGIRDGLAPLAAGQPPASATPALDNPSPPEERHAWQTPPPPNPEARPKHGQDILSHRQFW